MNLLQKTHPDPGRVFDPAEFGRRIAVDNTVRQLMIGTGVVAATVAFVLPGLGVLSTLVAPVVLLGLWLWVTAITARVGRTLPAMGKLIATEPDSAERAIDEALTQRPVMRWARLLTYHRLASLRHHQRRFHEAAAICQCVLNQPLKGPAAAARAHLLLMLAEAHLETGNLPGAYHAMAHLHQTRLGLAEALQRLALQTRYELAVGAYDNALHASRAKVELSELMPAVHCATMHAMLATAAHHAAQPKLADWLWQRTRLLAPPKLMGQLEQGGFGVGVVDHTGEPQAGPA